MGTVKDNMTPSKKSASSGNSLLDKMAERFKNKVKPLRKKPEEKFVDILEGLYDDLNNRVTFGKYDEPVVDLDKKLETLNTLMDSLISVKENDYDKEPDKNKNKIALAILKAQQFHIHMMMDKPSDTKEGTQTLLYHAESIAELAVEYQNN